MNKAIVVIGGGAGGMMAAICAARKGAHVTLLDPNERLGKKVNITGKGRCNVTNDSTCEELLAHVPQNPRFLYSVFSRFDGHDAIDFFRGARCAAQGRARQARVSRVRPVIRHHSGA